LKNLARTCAKAKTAFYTHQAQRIAGFAVSRYWHRSNLMNYICKAALVETLGVSTRTLENWIASLGFPAPLHVQGSRLAFFKLSAVEAWFASQLEGQE